MHGINPSRRKVFVFLAVLLAVVFVLGFIFTSIRLPQNFPARADTEPASISGISSSLSGGVTLAEPVLDPDTVDCVDYAWYTIPSGQGTDAYLTLNAQNQQYSSNSAIWRPNLPQHGYYRIEAYIPEHSQITWCTGSKVISSDTSEAHYTIHHALGSDEVVRNQVLPSGSSRWIDLGEYILFAGTLSSVELVDLNGETNFTRTVSFSTMRFTFVRTAPKVNYFPLVGRGQPVPVPTLPPPAVEIQQGAAFDTCHRPSLDKMQVWWNQSPYQTYAVYLGGISNTSCLKADAAWITAARQQGWSFIPTWVGPQAQCSVFRHKMDGDPAVAYQQGRSEAEQAAVAAYNIGLTYSGLSGTVIYYDLEGYGYGTTDDPCSAEERTAARAAAKSFLNGWTQRLHELGNASGIYGGALSTYPLDWTTIPYVPDYVWLASWYKINGQYQYDPNASIWIPNYLPNSLWANHQRVRQYAGAHNETYSGLYNGTMLTATIPIDSNVMDGAVVAATLPGVAASTQPQPAQPLAQQPLLPQKLLQDTGWLSLRQGWLVQSGELFWTEDAGQSWQDRTPAGLQAAPLVVQHAVFLDEQTAWALGNTADGKTALYATTDGADWQAVNLQLDPTLENTGFWQPQQLDFTTARAGHIVLELETSSAFDVAILLTTRDGGKTWQTFDLPASGEVSFPDPASPEGWLAGSSGWYYTADGGRTWQPTLPKNVPASSSAVPAGLSTAQSEAVVLQGQQENTLRTSFFRPAEPGPAWVVTRSSQCSGEKSSPGFTCIQQDTLWITGDSSTWQSVPLP